MTTVFAELTPLIDLDPELSAGLTEEEAAAAREALQVAAEWLPAGRLTPERLPQREPAAIVLVARGLVIRTTTLDDSAVAELVGPGGLIAPPLPGDQGRLGLHGCKIELTALETSLVAAIEPRTLSALAGFPDVAAALLRLAERHVADLHALRAIGQLAGVDRRLLALFRLLAARHGRETSDGIAVPLVLPHRLLAELVGLRRPTVSTALRQLADAGELRRLDDRTWLLPGATAALNPGRADPGRPRRFRPRPR
jgi:CRP/FNR family transcriptional regulator, cyclic AMP receptor protein